MALALHMQKFQFDTKTGCALPFKGRSSEWPLSKLCAIVRLDKICHFFTEWKTTAAKNDEVGHFSESIGSSKRMFMANLLLTNPCLSQRHQTDPLTFKHLLQFMTGNTINHPVPDSRSPAPKYCQGGKHILILAWSPLPPHDLTLLNIIDNFKAIFIQTKKSTFLWYNYKIQVRKSFFVPNKSFFEN